MKRMMMVAGVMAVVVGGVWMYARAGVEGKFTVGKETTVVEGPRNEDGTINYVKVINEMGSKGVTKENNGAIPLLQAFEPTGLKLDEKVRRTCEALGVEAPKAGGGGMKSLQAYCRGQGLSQDELQEAEKQMMEAARRPWKEEEMPVVAGWLKASEKGLMKVEEACGRERWYVPMVSEKRPESWGDALPPLAPVRFAGEALAARGMLKAGSGDVKGAIEDLQRERRLARLSVQGGTFISHLVGRAMDVQAMRAYQGWTASGQLNEEGLAAVEKAVGELGEMPSVMECFEVERMLALDSVMSCFRGDGEAVMRPMAMELDESKRVDLGDLAAADWDVVMKEVHHRAERIAAAWREQTMEKREAAMGKIVEEAIAAGEPASVMMGAKGRASGLPGIESFLKRREGESREGYSRRVGDLIMGDPAFEVRLIRLIEQTRFEKEMAMLAVALARYRLKHGTYPEKLGNVAPEFLAEVPNDPFTGKELAYRREGEGYLMYSVGMDGKERAGVLWVKGKN